MTTEPSPSPRAKIRDDFIRRLFAVAVSVGFASTLIQMTWVKSALLPTPNEQQQLAILFIGLFATVASWDGYLASIHEKPLEGDWRFSIDITLVFIYMFFLISSSQPTFWLPIIGVIFFLYTIWDALTIREHYEKYVPAGWSGKRPGILGVYLHGLFGDRRINRGPAITLCWFIYFVGLYLIGRLAFPEKLCRVFFVTLPCSFVLLGPMAFVGLLFYRSDKRARGSDREVGTLFRIVAIVILLGGALADYWLLTATL